MIDRRSLLGGAACAAASMGMVGCGHNDARNGAGTKDVPATWVSHRVGDLSAIDPLTVSDRAGLQVLEALFCPLTTIEDGRVKPFAARSFEVSSDAKTVTFHLAEGATFHNGEPVTASSFKRAWERLVKPLPGDDGDAKGVREEDPDRADALTHSQWSDLLSSVEGFEALYGGKASEMYGLRCPDDLTLVVTLSHAYAGFPALAAHPALGPVPVDADIETFAVHPVGNGPFKLTADWNGKGRLELARFDACMCRAAHVDGVVLVPYGETVAAYNQFQAGDLDICDVPVDQLDYAEKAAGVSPDATRVAPGERLVHGAQPGLTYLVCNTRVAPFDRIEFRRAVSCAIDREALCRKALNYSAEPARSPISPLLGECAPWGACDFDAERALELVEALVAEAQEEPMPDAGSSAEAAESDAVTTEPFKLDVALLHRKGGVQGRIASHVASDLKDIGVTVKAEALSAEELAKRYAAGEFACGLATLDPSVPTAEALAEALFDDASPRAKWQRAKGTELSEVLAAIPATVDETTRLDRVGEALALAGEELAVIPLAHPAYTMVVADRVVAANVGSRGTIELDTVELI